MCKVKSEAEENIIWAVGSGEISMWKDRWVNGRTLKEAFPEGQETNDELKAILTSVGWNEEAVKQKFPNQIANMIMNIPTCKQDKAYWKGSSMDNFSTKQTWEKIRQRKEVSRIHEKIWHHAIPMKITMITWRAIEGLIPTDLKMRRRGLIGPSKCQCCMHEESLEHILLSSQTAMSVWNHYNSLFGINMQVQTIVGMIKAWIYSHDWIQKGHIRTWVPQIIIWAIWRARNEAKHKGKKIKYQDIINSIDHKIQSITHTNLLKTRHYRGEANFCKKYSIRKKQEVRGRVITFKWEKPEDSWKKLNVDGCAKASRGCAAAGGLLRNSRGKLVFSFCVNLGSLSAYLAELHAARLGLRICMQKGWQQIWLEMDSLVLVKQINSNYKGNWNTFDAFMEIRKILGSMRWKCTHIWREANAAADLIASAGLATPLGEVIVDPQLGSPISGAVSLDAEGMSYWRRIKGQ